MSKISRLKTSSNLILKSISDGTTKRKDIVEVLNKRTVLTPIQIDFLFWKMIRENKITENKRWNSFSVVEHK